MSSVTGSVSASLPHCLYIITWPICYAILGRLRCILGYWCYCKIGDLTLLSALLPASAIEQGICYHCDNKVTQVTTVNSRLQKLCYLCQQLDMSGSEEALIFVGVGTHPFRDYGLRRCVTNCSISMQLAEQSFRMVGAWRSPPLANCNCPDAMDIYNPHLHPQALFGSFKLSRCHPVSSDAGLSYQECMDLPVLWRCCHAFGWRNGTNLMSSVAVIVLLSSWVWTFSHRIAWRSMSLAWLMSTEISHSSASDTDCRC